MKFKYFCGKISYRLCATSRTKDYRHLTSNKWEVRTPAHAPPLTPIKHLTLVQPWQLCNYRVTHTCTTTKYSVQVLRNFCSRQKYLHIDVSFIEFPTTCVCFWRCTRLWWRFLVTRIDVLGACQDKTYSIFQIHLMKYNVQQHLTAYCLLSNNYIRIRKQNPHNYVNNMSVLF